MNLGVPVLLTAVGALPLGGCDGESTGADSFSDEMPEPLPAGQCAGSTGTTDGCETDGTGEPVSTTSGAPGDDSTDACQASEDCLGDAVCAASWDEDTEVRGALACEFTCVGVLDEARWCSDASSCCDEDAMCTERGYCVLPEASPSTGSTGDASSTGASDDSSGTAGDTE